MKVPLAQLGEIPEGGIKEIKFFERSVLLTKVDNRYNAFRYNAFVNVCTHAGGPLMVNDGKLHCQWHQACFSLGNGKKLGGRGGTRSSGDRFGSRATNSSMSMASSAACL